MLPVLFLFLAAGSLSRAAVSSAICDSLYTVNDYQGSRECYEGLIRQDSTDAESHWKLARSLNLLAELEPKEKQLDLYEQAATAAKRCIELDSTIAEGHFQLARALGRIALFKGVFKSAGLAKQVKREAEKALALDPRHDGAMHLLGRWHREVAQKPKVLRAPMGLGAADKKAGLEFFERAIELNPELINHHLEYGISLYDLERDELAKAQFERCLELIPARPHDYLYQKTAKEYLAKLRQKD